MSSTDVKITILVDNRADNDLDTEHGFSLWIEVQGKKILFDTGQGGCLVPNARKLGIDLSEADVLALSHGHYDHTGGIPAVLELARNIRVYAHPLVVLPRYVVKEQESRSISMPSSAMSALDRLDSQSLVWVQKPLSLTDRIGLTGPIPRVTSFEDCGGAFYLDPEGTSPDPIQDDLSLWIRTNEGVILCTGCCHSGLVNTLQHLRHLLGPHKLLTILGGFHLVNADEERMRETIGFLQGLDFDRLVACHCTGESAMILLQQSMKERVLFGSAGMTFSFNDR